VITPAVAVAAELNNIVYIAVTNVVVLLDQLDHILSYSNSATREQGWASAPSLLFNVKNI
jgi:hypothetical protein